MIYNMKSFSKSKTFFTKASRDMKSVACFVVALFVFVSLAVAAAPRQEPPKTSRKKDDLLPKEYKFTGKNVVYNKQEGDRRLFVPNTKYNEETPSFLLIDSKEKWLSIKPILKVSHPILDKVNLDEDIVLIAFGGKREKTYRQMVGDLMYVEKKDGENKSLSVVMEVKVDDIQQRKNDVSFGYSSAAVVILSRSSLPEGFEIQKENFSLMFNREKEKDKNQKDKKKPEKYNVFGPVLRVSN